MSFVSELLLDKININKKLIDDWFEDKFNKNPALFYNSVDLRHSGFKISPVDNNCFPAGFNNINGKSFEDAKEATASFLQKNYPNAKKILLLPENHTRNIKYLENILVLKSLIKYCDDIEVEIGSLIEDLPEQLNIELTNNQNITLNKIIRKNNRISTFSNFDSDLIITNNDFTNKPEEILNQLEQDIVPNSNLGWYKRTKSSHFDIYNNLSKEIADLIGIDPWFISSYHKKCQNLDFKNKENIEDLAKLIDEVIFSISKKYNEYNIKEEPYCFVKADSGTYGLAMMTVRSGDEVLHMNKKQKNKMHIIKGSVINNRVIVQEGIPTVDKIQDITSEPMIYLINAKVIGNLSRVNKERDQNISLNSSGMEFRNIDNIFDSSLNIGGKKNDILKIYEFIARLSSLAAARE
jgi:glutamate--cysteine ligase